MQIMSLEGDSTAASETNSWVTIVLENPKGNRVRQLTFSLDCGANQMRAVLAARGKGKIDAGALVSVLSSETWEKVRRIPMVSRRRRELHAQLGKRIIVPSSDA